MNESMQNHQPPPPDKKWTVPYLSKFAADICSNVVAVLVSLYLLYRLLTIFAIELFCSI
jgi:hypothetical protein